jgi:FkbM family methyltransferase
MRRFKWWLRGLAQKVFPRFTLALLAQRTWVMEPEVALVPLLSRRKGVAVDAGANKGVFLYHLSRSFERVYGFEPLPQLVSYLKAAAPANVTVYGAALSNAPGTATLRLPRGFIELGSLEAHTSGTWTTDAPIEEHDVELKTLDSFGLRDVALLKIDVEGHELAVLEGARETISRYRPAVLVEVEERHREGGVARIRSYLEDLGYAGFYLEGLEMKPIATFDLKRDQNLASLEDSVKVGRYINNFIYFDRRESAERVFVIESALQRGTGLELVAALGPRHGATVRQRIAGPLRAARDMITAAAPRL